MQLKTILRLCVNREKTLISLKTYLNIGGLWFVSSVQFSQVNYPIPLGFFAKTRGCFCRGCTMLYPDYTNSRI